MATNKSMIEALERMNELMRELAAWNKVLKMHITEQKRQGGIDWNDTYHYNEKTGECKRVDRT
ncbi:MAG: hypothetical protein V1708_03365 [Candidatus Micrarchaeota archaeon]